MFPPVQASNTMLPPGSQLTRWVTPSTSTCMAFCPVSASSRNMLDGKASSVLVSLAQMYRPSGEELIGMAWQVLHSSALAWVSITDEHANGAPVSGSSTCLVTTEVNPRFGSVAVAPLVSWISVNCSGPVKVGSQICAAWG